MKIKSILLIIIFFILGNSLFADNPYSVLLKLCRANADRFCELRYYSFIYNDASADQKKIILADVEKIIDGVTILDYNNVDFDKFAKNFVYIVSKMSYLKFLEGDNSFIESLLNEAKGLNIYDETLNYMRNKYPTSFKSVPTAKNNRDSIKVDNFSNVSPMHKEERLQRFSNKLSVILVVPFSGNLKNIGDRALEGVLTASNFFGNKGDSLDLFIVDTALGEEHSVSQLESILKGQEVDIIIGPLQSSLEKNIVMCAKRFNKPIITLLMNPSSEIEYDLKFNHFLNIPDQVSQLCDFIKSESQHTGVLYPENSFGNRFTYIAMKNGFKPEISIGYSENEVDFRNEIIDLGNLKKLSSKDNRYIKQRELDSVLIADELQKALLIIPQLVFYDLKDIKIFGTNLWNSKDILNLEPRFRKNIFFIDLIDYSSNDADFLSFKNYLKKYFNAVPDFLNTLFYDTINLAFKIDMSSNVKIKSSFENSKFFLLTGDTYFDSKGESHKIFKKFKVENNEIVRIH